MRFRLCIATTALILLGLGAEASPVQAKPAVRGSSSRPAAAQALLTPLTIFAN